MIRLKAAKAIIYSMLIFSSSTVRSQEKSILLDSLYNSLYLQDKFTGNVLVAENGKPIFQKSYGQAFREKNEMLNSESIFELASVGKQFTAMAVMILKDRGKLTYSDSLRKFFPELPYHNITIRHLLNHTSGLPDYMELAEKYWDSSRIMVNNDMIALLSDKKPAIHFIPGAKWEYCNTGYALLGSIVEKVSGQSFRDFMSANIYQPLGMNRTLVYHKRMDKKILDNYAYGYVFDKKIKKYVMADSSDYANLVYSLDGIYGDGITNSTTSDLLKWDQALYSNILVSEATLKEAFEPGKLNDGSATDYGFGWFLRRSEQGEKVQFHSGGWPGYSTWIERFPESKKTVIILANSGFYTNSGKSVRKIIFGIRDTPPVAISLPVVALKDLEGKYMRDGRDSIRIFLIDDSLFVEGSGQPRRMIRPEKKDLFFNEQLSYKFIFRRDENDKVIALGLNSEVSPVYWMEKVL